MSPSENQDRGGGGCGCKCRPVRRCGSASCSGAATGLIIFCTPESVPTSLQHLLPSPGHLVLSTILSLSQWGQWTGALPWQSCIAAFGAVCTPARAALTGATLTASAIKHARMVRQRAIRDRASNTLIFHSRPDSQPTVCKGGVIFFFFLGAMWASFHSENLGSPVR
jgi:hypothetical protein